MSSSPGKFRVFLANIAWLLACMPGWVAFLVASRRIRPAQRSLLSRILRRNAATAFGREYHFESISTPSAFRKIPLSEYEDYRVAIAAIKSGKTTVLTQEPVELLQPTSGSTSATKLIPYTQAVSKQFKAAIDPWIASLYLVFPTLLFGRHYWSISPTTPHPIDPTSQVRIGFADDSEYLGVVQRFLARALFAVPQEISRVTNQDAFEYLTLLFLCREKNLRMVSVWHPSFLTVLLKALPGHFQLILRDIESGAIHTGLQLDSDTRAKLASYLSPCPSRASELAGIDTAAPDWPQALWPRLRVISCWTDGISEPWVSVLVTCFPSATIQGKGLTATEGIVTFPLGKSGQKVCAIRSHFLEFINITTGIIHNVWQVEAGKEYSVLLTTGGGLYRYRLHDLVRVTGFFNQTPCLDFISRDNLVSDLVGEKLSARHVEECIRHVEKSLELHFQFAMLAPLQEGDHAGYVLFIQPADGPEPDLGRVGCLMEEQLRHNYHYHHARNLSQLEPLRVFRIDSDAAASYRRHLIGKGMKPGNIKFQMLSTDRTWINEFSGKYVV